MLGDDRRRIITPYLIQDPDSRLIQYEPNPVQQTRNFRYGCVSSHMNAGHIQTRETLHPTGHMTGRHEPVQPAPPGRWPFDNLSCSLDFGLVNQPFSSYVDLMTIWRILKYAVLLARGRIWSLCPYDFTHRAATEASRIPGIKILGIFSLSRNGKISFNNGPTVVFATCERP